MIGVALAATAAGDAAAQTPATRVDGPRVGIQAILNNTGYGSTPRLRSTLRVDDSSYVIVGHLGRDGVVRVLFPLDPSDNGFVRASSQGYDLPDIFVGMDNYPTANTLGLRTLNPLRYDAADGGGGVVFVIASWRPMRFDRLADRGQWMSFEVSKPSYLRDPQPMLDELADLLTGERRDNYTVRFTRYYDNSYADNGYGYPSYSPNAYSDPYFGYPPYPGYSPFGFSSFGFSSFGFVPLGFSFLRFGGSPCVVRSGFGAGFFNSSSHVPGWFFFPPRGFRNASVCTIPRFTPGFHVAHRPSFPGTRPSNPIVGRFASSPAPARVTAPAPVMRTRPRGAPAAKVIGAPRQRDAVGVSGAPEVVGVPRAPEVVGVPRAAETSTDYRRRGLTSSNAAQGPRAAPLAPARREPVSRGGDQETVKPRGQPQFVGVEARAPANGYQPRPEQRPAPREVPQPRAAPRSEPVRTPPASAGAPPRTRRP